MTSCPLRRRSLLLAAAAPAGLLAGGCAAREVETFPTLASALQAIAALGDGSGWRSTGGFNLAQMLNHVAQSIEYSMQGFPQPKSALFRHTAGRAAFALFDARGAMSHSLSEPIPGAPPLASTDDLPAAVQRAQQVLLRFDQHSGPLQPHFAYGSLNKAEYLRAHLMHVAHHWTEVVPVPV